ncbi:MAG: SPFH/Band 7/PHB domain protein [Eubacteriales bacterium]|nr:SPFH/Band 7/PHB domain protein [Eubacteriales bacterium]
MLPVVSLVILIIVIALIGLLLVTNIRIVPQTEEWIIERLGVYSGVWKQGLHVKFPIVDRVAQKVSMKEQVLDVEKFNVITKDNVTVTVDTVIFFRVMDSKSYTYGVNNPIQAIIMLCNTTLRNLYGNMELDQSLTSRDQINGTLTLELDKATDPWGVKINRVELKNVIPPREIQDAMEKQMKAEREKRAQILMAEGQKQAQITEAEGQKQSQILKAEAAKEARVLAAEADKESQVLEAQGRADAIRQLRQAESEGYNMLINSVGKDGLLTLQSYDAFKTAANGKATKLIVPSDIQNLSGTLASLAEVVKDDKAPAEEEAK